MIPNPWDARGNPDLDDTIERLQAYERAGADVLGQRPHPGRPVAARDRRRRGDRVSVGDGLTWAAVEVLAAAAERIRDDGDFSLLGSSSRLRDWFAG